MSKIILCCPFYNENLVADINIAEASKWVDEIHITEFDKSFKYTSHDYVFQNDCEKVHYHQMDALKLYKKPRKYIPHFFIHPISRWMNKMVRIQLGIMMVYLVIIRFGIVAIRMMIY